MKRAWIFCLLGAHVGAVPGCAVLALPYPEGRSGRLTTVDGAPVAGAEVIVQSWSVDMVVQRRIAHEHTSVTRTDAEGRWAVRAHPSRLLTIVLPHAVPGREDDFTFRAAGHADLHVAFPARRDPPDATDRSTLRADGSGRPPLGATPSLVFGGALGAAQKVSAHAGGMFVVSRGGFGVGGRAAIEAGANGAGGDAGIVLVPFGGTTPNLGVELNARYLKPWSSPDARAEWGPEIAFDLIGYRLTLAWLGPEIDASVDRRRLVIGLGFGYF